MNDSANHKSVSCTETSRRPSSSLNVRSLWITPRRPWSESILITRKGSASLNVRAISS